LNNQIFQQINEYAPGFSAEYRRLRSSYAPGSWAYLWANRRSIQIKSFLWFDKFHFTLCRQISRISFTEPLVWISFTCLDLSPLGKRITNGITTRRYLGHQSKDFTFVEAELIPVVA
jgi:hypothetical protein